MNTTNPNTTAELQSHLEEYGIAAAEEGDSPTVAEYTEEAMFFLQRDWTEGDDRWERVADAIYHGNPATEVELAAIIIDEVHQIELGL